MRGWGVGKFLLIMDDELHGFKSDQILNLTNSIKPFKLCQNLVYKHIVSKLKHYRWTDFLTIV